METRQHWKGLPCRCAALTQGRRAKWRTAWDSGDGDRLVAWGEERKWGPFSRSARGGEADSVALGGITCPLRACGAPPPEGEEPRASGSAPYGGGQAAKRSGGGK